MEVSFGGRSLLLRFCIAYPSDVLHVCLQRFCPKSLKKLRRYSMASFGTVRRVSGPRLVKWECVLKRKDNGGLGICLVARKNLSLLAKWLLGFPAEASALWARVIKSKNDICENGWDTSNPISATLVTLGSVCQCLSLFFFPFYGW